MQRRKDKAEREERPNFGDIGPGGMNTEEKTRTTLKNWREEDSERQSVIKLR